LQKPAAAESVNLTRLAPEYRSWPAYRFADILAANMTVARTTASSGIFDAFEIKQGVVGTELASCIGSCGFVSDPTAVWAFLIVEGFNLQKSLTFYLVEGIPEEIQTAVLKAWEGMISSLS
jgi:hypothetical protein